MITFNVPLTDRDWDPAILGWRCPALKIPGLESKGLFVTGRVNPDWYEVEKDMEAVRWRHEGERPKHALLSVTIPDDLKTSQEASRASSFWKRLAVLVPVIVAAISASAGWFAHPEKSDAIVAGATCETWDVIGTVKLQDTGLTKDNLLAVTQPPEMRVDDAGKFAWKIPIVYNNRKPDFPQIVLVVQGTTKRVPTPNIYLGVPRLTSQEMDVDRHHIDLGEISFPKPPDHPYPGRTPGTAVQ